MLENKCNIRLRDQDERAEEREDDAEADLRGEDVALRPDGHARRVGAFGREDEDRDERRDEGEVVDDEEDERVPDMQR